MSNQLIEMLRYRRPHESAGERQFLERFLNPIEGAYRDDFGNIIKRIGKAPVLWSCHTDTVHSKGATMQKIAITGNEVMLGNGKSNCLGADDCAGVYILLKMIEAGVEGLYIFHRGEERGGLGSSFIEANTPELLDGIGCAIAFDRKGTDNLTTHQGPRTCSESFGRSLIKGLDMDYKLDDTGTFTDTANYTDLIGECTNLSVGYDFEHSRYETLNLDHVEKLLTAVKALDTSKLKIERYPGEIDPHDDWLYRYNDEDTYYTSYAKYSGAGETEKTVDLIERYPEHALKLFEDFGISQDDIRDYIFSKVGHYPY